MCQQLQVRPGWPLKWRLRGPPATLRRCSCERTSGDIAARRVPPMAVSPRAHAPPPLPPAALHPPPPPPATLLTQRFTPAAHPAGSAYILTAAPRSSSSRQPCRHRRRWPPLKSRLDGGRRCSPVRPPASPEQRTDCCRHACSRPEHNILQSAARGACRERYACAHACMHACTALPRLTSRQHPAAAGPSPGTTASLACLQCAPSSWAMSSASAWLFTGELLPGGWGGQGGRGTSSTARRRACAPGCRASLRCMAAAAGRAPLSLPGTQPARGSGLAGLAGRRAANTFLSALCPPTLPFTAASQPT